MELGGRGGRDRYGPEGIGGDIAISEEVLAFRGTAAKSAAGSNRVMSASEGYGMPPLDCSRPSLDGDPAGVPIDEKEALRGASSVGLAVGVWGAPPTVKAARPMADGGKDATWTAASASASVNDRMDLRLADPEKGSCDGCLDMLL